MFTEPGRIIEPFIESDSVWFRSVWCVYDYENLTCGELPVCVCVLPLSDSLGIVLRGPPPASSARRRTETGQSSHGTIRFNYSWHNAILANQSELQKITTAKCVFDNVEHQRQSALVQYT